MINKADVERAVDNAERKMGRKFNRELDRIRERLARIEEKLHLVNDIKNSSY